jgi:hypothetical protein
MKAHRKNTNIECRDGQWFFWDETLTNDYGPYDSNRRARKASKEYAKTIGHIIGKKEELLIRRK